jgi:hypothetical protein
VPIYLDALETKPIEMCKGCILYNINMILIFILKDSNHLLIIKLEISDVLDLPCLIGYLLFVMRAGIGNIFRQTKERIWILDLVNDFTFDAEYML